ncbi:hypothetical protein [Serratia fonticola]|uniref:hypothetical protein n=1 Tax=Serratia fonticola TaxID=47917 RepID=UPI0014153DC0|nr:hypothetical protein [Serratia fonticola]QIP94499.1 hypothetical protein HAP32_05127 [Serratia fonticola]
MKKMTAIVPLLLVLASFASNADTGIANIMNNSNTAKVLQITTHLSPRTDVGDFPGVADGELGHQLGCFIIHLFGYEAC